MGRTGSQKLAVLLCKLSDTANFEPNAKAFYEDFFVKRNTRGLNDSGSKRHWVPSTWIPPSKITGAIQLFGINPADYAGVVAIFNADVKDGGAAGGGVLCGQGSFSLTFLAHETGHVFGLSHSFDTSNRKDATWSAPGEYFDGYDIMSAMNVYSHSDPRFVTTGPLLCTANQDLMAWLPAGRIYTPAANQSSLTDIDLVSLGHSEVSGYLCAKVGSYYVEFRTNDDWDSGLISSMNGSPVNHSAHRPAVAMLVNGGFGIEVLSFNVEAKKARVRIHSQLGKPIINATAGPGQIFGGVAVDGGGWILVNGHIIPVPPRGPIVGMLSRLALVSQAEEMVNESTRAAVTGPIYKEIEDMAKKAMKPQGMVVAKDA
ncbi:MAG: hypothetical protein M1839_003162 [Geoglossum umbratile]|nr:MAG: hypothetical protein M1839_003162 [Geoglossum umbratile]